MHNMEAGQLDKAQKYSEKALAQIEKLKSKIDMKFSFLQNWDFDL